MRSAPCLLDALGSHSSVLARRRGGGGDNEAGQRRRGGGGSKALKQLLPLLLRVAGRKVLVIALLAVARTALSNRLARLQGFLFRAAFLRRVPLFARNLGGAAGRPCGQGMRWPGVTAARVQLQAVPPLPSPAPPLLPCREPGAVRRGGGAGGHQPLLGVAHGAAVAPPAHRPPARRLLCRHGAGAGAGARVPGRGC